MSLNKVKNTIYFSFSENYRLQETYENHLIIKLVSVGTRSVIHAISVSRQLYAIVASTYLQQNIVQECEVYMIKII